MCTVSGDVETASVYNQRGTDGFNNQLQRVSFLCVTVKLKMHLIWFSKRGCQVYYTLAFIYFDCPDVYYGHNFLLSTALFSELSNRPNFFRLVVLLSIGFDLLELCSAYFTETTDIVTCNLNIVHLV